MTLTEFQQMLRERELDTRIKILEQRDRATLLFQTHSGAICNDPFHGLAKADSYHGSIMLNEPDQVPTPSAEQGEPCQEHDEDCIHEGHEAEQPDVRGMNVPDTPEPTGEPNELDWCDDCGLTNWSCNRLQDLVYDTMPTTDRRKLAVQIRDDMREARATLQGSDPTGDGQYYDPSITLKPKVTVPVTITTPPPDQELAIWDLLSANERKPTEQTVAAILALIQAARRELLDEVLGVIGEDERDISAFRRSNQLRAELREAIEQLRDKARPPDVCVKCGFVHGDCDNCKIYCAQNQEKKRVRSIIEQKEARSAESSDAINPSDNKSKENHGK